MYHAKLKVAAAMILAFGLLGVGWLAHPAHADKPEPKDKPKPAAEAGEVVGYVKSVDADRNAIALFPGKGAAQGGEYEVAKEADIYLDDGTGDKLGFRPGRLADLGEGVLATLRLTAERKVVRIWAEGPAMQGVLKSADAEKRTVTVALALKKTEPPADHTFAVAPNAKLSVDDGKPVDKSKPMKAVTLADLPANSLVTLKLSADRKSAGSVRAEGQRISGIVKALDADKRTITVVIAVNKGEDGEEKTFAVDKNAFISIDDDGGKAKPKAGRLADVPLGAAVTLRLSLDQKAVMQVRAEGSSVHAPVKAVDLDKGTITLHWKTDNDRTFAVSKDVAVTIDGQPARKALADVHLEAMATLKLQADQKTVREIHLTGPTMHGTVRGQAENGLVTLGNKEGDKAYSLAPKARIVIDEIREGKVADLIDGTEARLRLSADQTAVLEVFAHGPRVRGIVKGFAADTGILTLLVGSKNGVGGEDKEFKTAKTTEVATELNGAALKLADLKADKEVEVRLAIDQKAAAKIIVLGE